MFVTEIVPVVPPAGAVAFNCVLLTCCTVAALVPWNFTVDVLLKPAPVIVTTVPAGPPAGLRPVIDSVGVKLVPLVPAPAGVVTEIFPTAAPLGTTAFSCVPDTNVTEGEASPANFTVAPGAKWVPLIVTVLRRVDPGTGRERVAHRGRGLDKIDRGGRRGTHRPRAVPILDRYGMRTLSGRQGDAWRLSSTAGTRCTPHR